MMSINRYLNVISISASVLFLKCTSTSFHSRIRVWHQKKKSMNLINRSCRNKIVASSSFQMVGRGAHKYHCSKWRQYLTGWKVPEPNNEECHRNRAMTKWGLLLYSILKSRCRSSKKRSEESSVDDLVLYIIPTLLISWMVICHLISNKCK